MPAGIRGGRALRGWAEDAGLAPSPPTCSAPAPVGAGLGSARVCAAPQGEAAASRVRNGGLGGGGSLSLGIEGGGKGRGELDLGRAAWRVQPLHGQQLTHRRVELGRLRRRVGVVVPVGVRVAVLERGVHELLRRAHRRALERL